MVVKTFAKTTIKLQRLLFLHFEIKQTATIFMFVVSEVRFGTSTCLVTFYD